MVKWWSIAWKQSKRVSGWRRKIAEWNEIKLLTEDKYTRSRVESIIIMVVKSGRRLCLTQILYSTLFLIFLYVNSSTSTHSMNGCWFFKITISVFVKCFPPQQDHWKFISRVFFSFFLLFFLAKTFQIERVKKNRKFIFMLECTVGNIRLQRMKSWNKVKW